MNEAFRKNLHSEKYIQKAKEEIEEFLVRRGSKGASIKEIAAAMGVKYDRIRKWMGEFRFPHQMNDIGRNRCWIYFANEKLMESHK